MPRRKPKAQEPTVDVIVDLGELKAVAQRVAKKSGVGLNEFICNALESRIRQHREYNEPDSFVRHGGKHLTGKHTGYEVTQDGKYYPAPSWTQQFDLLFAERAAVHNLANSLVQQMQERLIAIESSIAKAKGRMVDDLGLDPAKSWVYYGGSYGHLEEEERPKKKR